MATRKMYKYVKGDRVMIYDDPLTKQKEMGEATLLKLVGAENEQGYYEGQPIQLWVADFGEAGAPEVHTVTVLNETVDEPVGSIQEEKDRAFLKRLSITSAPLQDLARKSIPCGISSVEAAFKDKTDVWVNAPRALMVCTWKGYIQSLAEVQELWDKEGVG